MRGQKRQLLKYSPEDMEAALADCDRGLPVATSAKKHKVPRITLLYKFREIVPRKCTMGLKSYLSKEEETILCQWITQAGFPVGKDQLLDSVQQLMIELKRENPFQNNRPGKSWYKLFLKRNPEISARTPQNLTSSRASVTTEKLNRWFSEVYEYLKSQNFESILNHPERVFNADEAAFFLNPKGDKVLAKRGEKNVYQIINSDEKECLTVLLTANAAGNIAPPMVVFKYERIPKEIAMSVPEHWGLGKSDTGWMTRETFFEFVTNIFHPWLIENKIVLPVLLFIDGHVSHLTLHLSRFCDRNGIILVALYPNATHLLQPMDVAVFRTVKAGWKEHIYKFRLQHADNPTVKKSHFCPLLAKTLEERLDVSVLSNGFRKCGLVPWNPDEVSVQIQRGDIAVAPAKEDSQDKLCELKAGKAFLEKYIDQEKLKQFKSNYDMWTGQVEDVSLYKFYIKIIKDIETLEKENTINIIYDNEENSGSVNNIRENVSLMTQEEAPEAQNEPIPSTSASETPIKILSDITISTQNIYHKTPIKVDCHNITNASPTKLNKCFIPSPFKRALTWPEPKPLKKARLSREKIPSVVTSKQWQLYYENKENKKKEEETKKRIRAEERQRKKAILEKAKQEKVDSQKRKKQKMKRKSITVDSETSEEWEPSDTSDDEISSLESLQDETKIKSLRKQYEGDFKENDYVLVKFPGKKREHLYVCVIQQLMQNNEAEVVGLKKCDDELSFRLNEGDISVIHLNQIIEKLNFPKMILAGDRLKYQFDKELHVDG